MDASNNVVSGSSSGGSGSAADSGAPPLTLATIAMNLHLPLKEVAQKLRVSETTVKHHCRRYGIDHWPHRIYISVLQRMQARHMVVFDASTGNYSMAPNVVIRSLNAVLRRMLWQLVAFRYKTLRSVATTSIDWLLAQLQPDSLLPETRGPGQPDVDAGSADGFGSGSGGMSAGWAAGGAHELSEPGATRPAWVESAVFAPAGVLGAARGSGAGGQFFNTVATAGEPVFNPQYSYQQQHQHQHQHQQRPQQNLYQHQHQHQQLSLSLPSSQQMMSGFSSMQQAPMSLPRPIELETIMPMPVALPSLPSLVGDSGVARKHALLHAQTASDAILEAVSGDDRLFATMPPQSALRPSASAPAAMSPKGATALSKFFPIGPVYRQQLLHDGRARDPMHPWSGPLSHGQPLAYASLVQPSPDTGSMQTHSSYSGSAGASSGTFVSTSPPQPSQVFAQLTTRSLPSLGHEH